MRALLVAIVVLLVGSGLAVGGKQGQAIEDLNNVLVDHEFSYIAVGGRTQDSAPDSYADRAAAQDFAVTTRAHARQVRAIDLETALPADRKYRADIAAALDGQAAISAAYAAGTASYPQWSARLAELESDVQAGFRGLGLGREPAVDVDPDGGWDLPSPLDQTWLWIVAPGMLLIGIIAGRVTAPRQRAPHP